MKPLPKHERKVMEGLRDSKTYKEIAKTLGIHPKTVETYVDRVRIKVLEATGINHTRTGLVEHLIDSGFLQRQRFPKIKKEIKNKQGQLAFV